MKRIMVLIGAGLIMVFLCGMETEVYGQQCCNYGYYGYHYISYSGGWCDESPYPYCGYDECIMCNPYDVTQCIYNGGDWDPYYCYCDYSANACNNIIYWEYLGWYDLGGGAYCADCYLACGSYGWAEYYYAWGTGYTYCGTWEAYYYYSGCWDDYSCTDWCYWWCY